MAKRNVTLRTRSRKEKPEQSNKQRNRQKPDTNPKDQHPPIPLIQHSADGEWLISKALLDTPSPIHNHFIGMLHKDTLVNVRDGIETISALLGQDNENSIFLTKSYIGAYWMMLNMIEALQFEIYHRDKLTTAQP